MATIAKKVYHTGVQSVKIPGISGDIKYIQVDIHGGGGGGTTPLGTMSGGSGGYGAHVAGMFAIPGGSELHIGVAGGGGAGTPGADEKNGGIVFGWQEDKTYPTSGGGKGGMEVLMIILYKVVVVVHYHQ